MQVIEAVIVRFEPDREVWTFEPARQVASTVADALVAVTLPGLRWVVPVLRCSEPHAIEVEASPSPWARQAVATLLGDAAAALLDGPTVGADDAVTVPVTGGLDAAARRSAVGMLAIALAGTPRGPLQALDIAALLQRAGLASPTLLPPGADDLADDAVEALDLLPAIVIESLDEASASARSAGWAAATAGLAEVRRFVATAGALPLDVDVDVDASFASLTGDLADLVLAGAAAADDRSLLMGGDLGVTFRGGRPSRSIDLYVADEAVRGLTGRSASFDPDTSLVSVRVGARGLALHPAFPQIFARVIAEESREVLQVQPLAVESGSGGGPRLTARFELPADARPARAELVLDPDQPVLDLAGTRRLDAAYQQGEAVANLIQVACLQNDPAQSRALLRERLAAELTRDEYAEVLDGRELEIFPTPSAGLLTVLGDLAESVVDSLRAVDDPRERAAQAHNLALLITDGITTWGQGLAGDTAMIEAEARLAVDGVASATAIAAARRAEAAFHLAGRPADAARARAWLDEQGEGGA